MTNSIRAFSGVRGDNYPRRGFGLRLLGSLPRHGERGRDGARGELRKNAHKTVEANTMTTLPPRVGRKAFPADGLLAPGAHDLAIPLAGEHVACVMQDHLGLGEEGAGGANQVATACVRAITVHACRWGCHTLSSPEKDSIR